MNLFLNSLTFVTVTAKGKGNIGVKTAKLYAWVALQSLPEEMVISPCLLDFLEKALETIPITPIERNYTSECLTAHAVDSLSLENQVGNKCARMTGVKKYSKKSSAGQVRGC